MTNTINTINMTNMINMINILQMTIIPHQVSDQDSKWWLEVLLHKSQIFSTKTFTTLLLILLLLANRQILWPILTLTLNNGLILFTKTTQEAMLSIDQLIYSTDQVSKLLMELTEEASDWVIWSPHSSSMLTLTLPLVFLEMPTIPFKQFNHSALISLFLKRWLLEIITLSK